MRGWRGAVGALALIAAICVAVATYNTFDSVDAADPDSGATNEPPGGAGPTSTDLRVAPAPGCSELAQVLDHASGRRDAFSPAVDSVAALLARAFRILGPPIQAVLAADANIYLPSSAPAEDLATVDALVAAIPGVLEVEALSSTAAYEEAQAALAGSAAAEVVPQPLAPLVHVFAAEEAIVRVRAALADAVPGAVIQTRAELLAERDRGASPVEDQLRLVSGAMAALSTSGPAELQEAALALTSPTLSSSADVEALRPHADILVQYATETCGIPTVR